MKGLLAAGVNILVIGIILIGYGAIYGNYQVLGIGATLLLAGISLAGVSTIGEETTLLLENVIRFLIVNMAYFLEAMDLVNNKIWAFRRERSYIVISQKIVKKESIGPGIGIAEGTPYIALPISDIMDTYTDTEVVDNRSLVEALHEKIVNEYKISDGVSIETSAGLLKIELVNIKGRILNINYPIDPLVVIILSIVHGITGRDLVIIDYEYISNNLIISLKEVGDNGG